MKYMKIAYEYLKDRFVSKEITSYVGLVVIALYVFGVISGEQYANLYNLVETMGWGMPGIGAALIAAPTSKMKAKK